MEICCYLYVCVNVCEHSRRCTLVNLLKICYLKAITKVVQRPHMRAYIISHYHLSPTATTIATTMLKATATAASTTTPTVASPPTDRVAAAANCIQATIHSLPPTINRQSDTQTHRHTYRHIHIDAGLCICAACQLISSTKMLFKYMRVYVLTSAHTHARTSANAADDCCLLRSQARRDTPSVRPSVCSSARRIAYK